MLVVGFLGSVQIETCSISEIPAVKKKYNLLIKSYRTSQQDPKYFRDFLGWYQGKLWQYYILPHIMIN